MPPGRCCSPAASHGPVKWADSSGGEKNRGEEGRQLPAKGEPHPWGAAARAITRACRPPPPPAPFHMEGVNAVYHPAEAGGVGGWLDYAPLRVTLPPSWPPSQGVAATMGRKTTGGGHGEGSQSRGASWPRVHGGRHADWHASRRSSLPHATADEGRPSTAGKTTFSRGGQGPPLWESWQMGGTGG